MKLTERTNGMNDSAPDRATRILADLTHAELVDCLHQVRIYAADASDGRSEVPAWTLGSTITSCITRYLTAAAGDDVQPTPTASPHRRDGQDLR